jgi:hypothetical protein
MDGSTAVHMFLGGMHLLPACTRCQQCQRALVEVTLGHAHWDPAPAVAHPLAIPLQQPHGVQRQHDIHRQRCGGTGRLLWRGSRLLHALLLRLRRVGAVQQPAQVDPKSKGPHT